MQFRNSTKKKYVHTQFYDLIKDLNKFKFNGFPTCSLYLEKSSLFL